MKVAYILLLTLTLGQAYAVGTPKGDAYTQSRPYSYEYMTAELSRVHKAVFSLPFEYEYIKGTLMPEIEAQRLVVAPHFPSRAVTGDNPELVKQHFETWHANYPQEFADYIAYVEQFVIDHNN